MLRALWHGAHRDRVRAGEYWRLGETRGARRAADRRVGPVTHSDVMDDPDAAAPVGSRSRLQVPSEPLAPRRGRRPLARVADPRRAVRLVPGLPVCSTSLGCSRCSVGDWSTYIAAPNFVRDGPWLSFPIGRIPGYMAPVGTWLGQVDSFPILYPLYRALSLAMPHRPFQLDRVAAAGQHGADVRCGPPLSPHRDARCAR